MRDMAASFAGGALTRAVVLRDRMRMLFGTPLCELAGHDWTGLKHDPVMGYYQSCGRCGKGDLLWARAEG